MVAFFGTFVANFIATFIERRMPFLDRRHSDEVLR